MKNIGIGSINRSIEIEIETDMQPVRYPSLIVTVEPDTVDVICPEEGGEVIEVPFGTEVILYEKPQGKPPEQYKLTALDQGWNIEFEAWMLTLAQPDPLLEDQTGLWSPSPG